MSRAFLNCLPWPTAASSGLAPNGPIPGTVSSLRATSSRATRASISRLISPMRRSMAREIVEQAGQQPAHRRREIVRLVCQQARKVGFELARSLMDCDTVLETEGTHLADHAGAMHDHHVPCPMQRLNIDLFGSLDLDEAHRRSRDGFGNRFRVDQVVLVALDVGLHELGPDDPDGVTEPLDLACQPLRTWAGFHADNGGSGTLEELKQRVAPETRSLHGLARSIQTDHVEESFLPISTPNTAASRGRLRVVMMLPFCLTRTHHGSGKRGGPSH